MLLEEALAGHSSAPGATHPSTPGGAANAPPPLSPHDAALAVLSFVRDELPAGGTPAEKRFVRLFPLVIDRAFGTWDDVPVPPEGSPRGSPGGGVRSPPVSSPGESVYASPRASSSPSPSPSPAGERDCRHAAGGWLGLPTPPPSRGPVGGSGRGTPSPPRSATRAAATTSPDQDPIVLLLRAPRARGGEESSGGGYYYAPTLLDALSAESFRRPSVRFKFPLAGLAGVVKPLTEDWRACFWEDFEKEAARVAAANAAAGRGGFGPLQGGGVARDERKEETPPGAEGKENATRILLRLLAGPPGEQLELRFFFQREYQQKHQPQGGHGVFGNFGSPVLRPPSPLKQRSRGTGNNFGYQTPNRGGNASVNNEPKLELTMLEFYLLLFIRFPLANTVWETQTRDHHERQRRVGGRKLAPPYGQRLHAHLFQSYLRYFLPLGTHFDERMLGVGADCFDASRTIETCASFVRTSELFLRLIIELWVEGPNVAPTAQDAVARYRRVRGGVSLSASQTTAPQPSLGDSLELAQPSRQPFAASPPQVQSYVLTLVRHLVSDRSMRDLVQSVSARVQRRQRDEREGAAAPSLVNEGASDIKNSGGRASSQSGVDGYPVVPWCLPPALTAAQPSLFNFVRMGLACGAIHDKSSAFHWALEAWLAWLEPWNYVLKQRAVPKRSGSGNAAAGGSRRAGQFLRHAAATVASHRGVEYYPSYVQPKPTSPSAYSDQWEAYVLANVHFYTVPLAVFLKRARELDFASPTEHPRSLALVQRVLRVYSAAVVNVLNGVLNKRADALSMSLFAKHQTNLRAFCPPNTWKLVDCQCDATNLLEEVFGQHRKRRAGTDFFDRLEARLNAMMAGKSGGDEAALKNLLSQVQYLVGLPRDYRVLPEEPRASPGSGMLRLLRWGMVNPAASAAIFEKIPDRGPDGLLTDLGRQQIYSGQRKCNPFDVTYIGDPMLARVKTYEIPTLVRLTIGVSNYLNRKLGFTLASEGDIAGGAGEDALSRNLREMEQYQKVMFRINLRFLANYRNIIFIATVWWLRRVIFSTS